jgi:hypothetical protein
MAFHKHTVDSLLNCWQQLCKASSCSRLEDCMHVQSSKTLPLLLLCAASAACIAYMLYCVLSILCPLPFMIIRLHAPAASSTGQTNVTATLLPACFMPQTTNYRHSCCSVALLETQTHHQTPVHVCSTICQRTSCSPVQTDIRLCRNFTDMFTMNHCVCSHTTALENTSKPCSSMAS